MPNTYLKSEKYVALALATLLKRTVLPMAFTRFDATNFRGAKNDTVAVWRTPGITTARDYEWRTRTAPIVLDRIARSETTISMHDHIYSAVGITDEELTLDITNFNLEVLDPQMQALVTRAEGKVLNALKNANAFKVQDFAVNATERPLAVGLRLKAILDRQGTPAAGRKWLVSSEMAAWIMLSDDLQKYDPSAANTAYREALVGRLAGMDIVEVADFDTDEFYVVHPSALVFANMAPSSPQGATYSARQSYDGWALRVLKDYDPNYLRDRSIVSMYGGVAPVKDELKMKKDALGMWVPDFDLQAGEDPVYTDFNVRGLKGVFTPPAEAVITP